MKAQTAPKLATSKTGIIHGKGSVTDDKVPALLANQEAVLNAGAAAAFQKVTGMSIEQFNEIYAPKGAETKMVDGVLHAADGFDPYSPNQKKNEYDARQQALVMVTANPAINTKAGMVADNSPARQPSIQSAMGQLFQPIDSPTTQSPGIETLLGEKPPTLAVTPKPVANSAAFTAGKYIATPSAETNHLGEAKKTYQAGNKAVADIMNSALNTVATSSPVQDFKKGAGIPTISPQPTVANTAPAQPTQPENKISPAPKIGTVATPPTITNTLNVSPASTIAKQMTGEDLTGKGITKSVGAGKNGTTLYSNIPNEQPSSVVPQLKPSVQVQDGSVQTSGGWVNPQTGAPIDNSQVAMGNEQPAVMPSYNPLAVSQTPKRDNAIARAESDSRLQGSVGQGGSVNMGGDGGQVGQSNPPYIQNGKLVQPPQLLTPQQPYQAQTQYQAPELSSYVTPETQQTIQNAIERNIRLGQQDMTVGANRINAKYAGKQLEDLLGKDTQEKATQLKANDQAQEADRFNQTGKQKANEDAWNRLLQSTGVNYKAEQDQAGLEAGKRTLEFEATKEAQKQANFEREQTQKENAPIDFKSLGEDGMQKTVTRTPKQIRAYEADYSDYLKALDMHRDNPEMIAKIKEKAASRGII